MKIFKLIMIWLLFFTLLTAGESGSFLKLGYGAKAIALGEAYTAVANDAYAPYWNPAGLGIVEKDSLTTTSFAWNESQAFYIGNITRLGQNLGTLGITYINFSSAPIELYDTNGNYLGKSSVIGDQATIISYGKSINDFSLGLNLKKINSSIISITSFGEGFDLGLLYRHELSNKPTGFSQIALGFVITDVGNTKLDYGNNIVDVISEQKKLGISTYLNGNTFLFSFDYWLPKNRLPQKHYGIEYIPQENFALCLGLQDELVDSEAQKIEQMFSLGTSLKYAGFEFEYSVVFHPQESMNFFSLAYVFDSIFDQRPAAQSVPVKKR